MICAHLADITTAELHEIAEHPNLTGEPSGLQAMMARFFENDSRVHVHSVAYLSAGDITGDQFLTGDRLATHLGERGASYVFTNKAHPARDDPHYRIFLD